MAYPYSPYQPYPQNYPQNYGQSYQQMQSGQQSQPQIQNGGFIPVRGEQEARSYPVAPGMSITFKDELAPYVYTKTMGFSQLDRPVFDRYRLVKEEPAKDTREAQTSTEKAEPIDLSIYAKKDEIKAISEELDALQKEIDSLKESVKDKEAVG